MSFDRRTRRPANLPRPVRAGSGVPSRRSAERRAFTLVEMLVSVTLVLMMMLMFAEIYGLAQGTISTQKGIAENDQKARILSQVIRRDFDTRTFRSVYPFKLEDPAFVGTGPQPSVQSALIELRRGYFSISENDAANDTDDVLQLTIEVDQTGFGGTGDRVYGKASLWPSPPPSPPNTKEQSQDNAEYDDGIEKNGAAMSGAAEVSYFLRNGNLFRSVLLIRDPYVRTTSDGQPPIDSAWAGTDPRLDYDTFSTEFAATSPPPAGPPYPKRTVWNDFDFSVYRWGAPAYAWRFHTIDGLSNDPAGIPIIGVAANYYRAIGGDGLYLFPALGAPYLRFGHMFSDLGQPLEFNGAQFLGRFTVPERSSVKTAASNDTFVFPGNGWAPFDGSIGNYEGTARRGVDLMLSNVHSFDVEVWDDVVGQFVDLGHDLTGKNPYTGEEDQEGFYHISRLRDPFPRAMVAPGAEPYYDHPAISGNFGNRYDTWHPHIVAGGTGGRRVGRAPYRPQRTNPDPKLEEFNDPPPPLVPVDPTSLPSITRESRMAFGDRSLDDDGDGMTLHPRPAVGQTAPDPDDTDAEAPLRAVRITIRYLDANSGQMRQSTIESSLID